MFFFVWVVLFSFILKSTHLLSMLISLEFMSLMIFFLFSFLYFQSFIGVNILIALLVAMGCESVLGLILFVVLSRFYSKDYFLSAGLFSF